MKRFLGWLQRKKEVIGLVVVLTLALQLSGVGIQVGDRGDFTEPSWEIGIGNKVLVIGMQGALGAGTADYTCDGINDDVQFQAALNALPVGGGKIIFLAGDYVFGAQVTRAIDDVQWQGAGEASNISWNGVNTVIGAGAQASWVFRDFSTDAGGVDISTATDWTMVNVNLGGTYYAYRTDLATITADEWAIPVGRGVTVVVAASDADAQSIAQADYRCDGTADNVEIQAALDALPVAGGEVVLLEGNYSTILRIIVPSHTRLKINGTITLTSEDPAHPGILIDTGSDDIHITGGILDGNSAVNVAVHSGILISGSTNVTVQGVELQNWGGFSIYNFGSPGVLIENNYVHDGDEAGIVLEAAGTNIVDVNVLGNRVVNNGLVGAVAKGGIYFESSGGTFIKHSNINDNIVEGNRGAGMSLLTCHYINVLGNQVYDNYQEGIVPVSSTHVVIVGNTVYNNDVGAVPGSDREITLGSSTDCIVVGNTIGGSGGSYALVETGSADRNLIAFNNVMNNSVHPLLYAKVGNSTIISGNMGHIYQGEIRTASGILTAGVANAICFAWNNPEIQDILIKRVVIETTTAGGTGGSHLDVGIADDAAGTNRGVEFFDDLLLNTTIVHDSWVVATNGTQTTWVLCQDVASVTDDWIVGQILDANAASLVGTYYIEYVGR